MKLVGSKNLEGLSTKGSIGLVGLYCNLFYSNLFTSELIWLGGLWRGFYVEHFGLPL